jgi:hypothetical protein
MADLGSNSIWSDITGAASNAEGAVDNVASGLLGPDYSYADNIQGPSSLGVSDNGTFGQLGTNAEAIAYYVEALITGNPPLGNQFFVNTGGTCTAPDGQLRSRYNYINNMSSGAAALPAAMSELGSDFNGLIPGVVDDIEGLDPLYIFSAMAADASPQCGCYKCDVTSGSPYQWLTPSLSADFSSDQCTQADSSYCPAASSTESFTNQSSDIISAIPTIVAALGVALLVFSGK